MKKIISLIIVLVVTTLPAIAFTGTDGEIGRTTIPLDEQLMILIFSILGAGCMSFIFMLLIIDMRHNSVSEDDKLPLHTCYACMSFPLILCCFNYYADGQYLVSIVSLLGAYAGRARARYNIKHAT